MKTKKCYFSLYDDVLKDFGPIFECKNDKVAVVQIKKFFDEAIKKDKYFDSNSFSLYHLFDIDFLFDDSDDGDEIPWPPTFEIIKIDKEVNFSYGDEVKNE